MIGFAGHVGDGENFIAENFYGANVTNTFTLDSRGLVLALLKSLTISWSVLKCFQTEC